MSNVVRTDTTPTVRVVDASQPEGFLVIELAAFDAEKHEEFVDHQEPATPKGSAAKSAPKKEK